MIIINGSNKANNTVNVFAVSKNFGSAIVVWEKREIRSKKKKKIGAAKAAENSF